LLDRLLQSQQLQLLHRVLQQEKSILAEELWDAPKAVVATIASEATGKNLLIITAKVQEESRLFHDLEQLSERSILDFPAWETLPSENIAPSPDIVGERYQILSTILHRTEPQVIIASLQACLQKLIPPPSFDHLYFTLKVAETMAFDSLIERLTEMGYQRCPLTSDKGEFAVRGGIIDVFPVSSPDPFRIEFWGDTIESLRIFDPIGQKSIQLVDQMEVTPAQEMELLEREESPCTLFDYLGENTIVIFDDLLSLEDRYAALIGILGKPTKTFCNISEFLERTASLQTILWSQQPIEELSEVAQIGDDQTGFYSHTSALKKLSFQLFNREFLAIKWQHPFIPPPQYLLPEKGEESTIAGDEILLALSRLSGPDYTLSILCSSEAEQSHVSKRLLNLKVTLPEKTEYRIGYLSSGFALHEIKYMILPMTEITQRYKIRRQKLRSTYHTAPSEVFDLTPGELVVHLNNGIGKYLGLEKKKFQGIESEFFLIEYAEGSKLYVPINQAHLVSKYIGANEQLPRLHTLGSNRWKRARETTEQAIMGYAADLLKMYAKRQVEGGFSYPKDSPDIHAFEEEFPFIETEDQLQAISSIKSDMCSSKSMDRLICGDVGYGKTEIAMRAVFKAVVDGGKQVAMLVPTTVLAMQHYENFVARMMNFPINIAVLSRFRTAKQTKDALEGLKNGSVDVVIGTHRIISKDIQFKDLGLIVIDEEQRFGVKAKEHLKTLKSNVDCITLTATPIPRTLYLSLVGAKDMSLINTPPQDRLPIKTVIAEPNEILIKNALLRELARDGQAFFIHNRVETIYGAADRLKKVLPMARIGVVHGQMHPDEIDTVFHAFKNQSLNILVATTIIENGIDIPNANTILIDRADRFGLAELYQMRGRVGRWNRRAYAYFLIPRFRALPEISQKRLQALAEASGYGGGMRLAMRDLEIRGAGHILGTEQSGHVSSLGFHLYCKLLKRAKKSLEGTMPSVFTDTKIDIPVDARLPEDYINESRLRMEIYQRLGEALSKEEMDQIWQELADRFGPQPEPAVWLYHLSRIRVFASLNGYTHVKVQKCSLHTEQKQGKKIVKRQQDLGKITTPEDLEVKILALLREHANVSSN